MIYCTHLNTNAGLLRIEATGSAITLIIFVKKATKDRPNEMTNLAVSQLTEYLAGKRKVFSLPLSFNGTPFQKSVWNALLEIPYGEAVSYHDIAKAIGNPKASRAVGSANGKNPISIVIPCHRVIASHGGLGGYSGGLDKKRYLLKLEKISYSE